MEWLLEIALLVLLAATLFQALRLERALGVLKRDRAALEDLVTGFNASTRAAEQGIDHLRTAAEGAGRNIQRQIEAATGLKDDLLFLTERGERLADRMETLVRQTRGYAQDPPGEPVLPLADRMGADRMGADRYGTARPDDQPAGRAGESAEPGDGDRRLRSKAERDLLRALRATR